MYTLNRPGSVPDDATTSDSSDISDCSEWRDPF
jgi:hypothetical protein